MEEKSKIDLLLIHARDYIEERIKLISLEIHDKVSRGVSGVAFSITMMLFGIFTLFFFSVALSWWIGLELNAVYLGFLIVGGIYLLSGLIIFINRDKWIRLPVINAFLKNIADEED